MFCIVTVKDNASASFSQPVMVRSLALAERSFKDEVNRQSSDNAIYNHPKDFALYHVGTFDEDTGVIDAVASPVCISQAVDLKSPV